MTNMELAQQQGNQAAPNLLDAIKTGEIGSGSMFILPEQAAFTIAGLDDYPIESAQADETVAQTLYDNMKIVSPKLALFILKEVYTPESEEQESQEFIFIALSSELLDFLKNQVDTMISSYSAIFPTEDFEAFKVLLNGITPDELFTSESATMILGLTWTLLDAGYGDLPAVSRGVADYRITKADESSNTYYYECMVAPSKLIAITHTATTILGTPVKLEKPMYSMSLKN